MRSAAFVAACVAAMHVIPGPGRADPRIPDDGAIGIYADSAGSSACATIPAGSFGVLYVLATPSEATAGGITGAEFRIEVRHPEGWLFSFHPAAGAILLGNPLDVHPGDASDGSGMDIAFDSCRPPDIGSGKVLLGTIQALNRGGTPTDLWVKRHTTPSNRSYSCPLLLDCREPQYNKWCVLAHVPLSCSVPGDVSIPEEDCDEDPVFFTAAINKEVEPPPQPDRRPTHPEREVIVMFVHRSAIELPPGRIYASLDSTRVQSVAVESVLRRYGVEVVSKAFPCFELADTLCTRSDGSTFRCVDWSTTYVLLMRRGGDPEALSEALSALWDDVVYAEPNGFAATTDSDRRFSLPNPMRPGSTIAFELPRPTRVQLDFYDAAGRRVRRLADEALPSGHHALIWDGKTDAGMDLPAGVYFVRVLGIGKPSTHKVVHLR